jgi:hypothetical protein
VHAQTVVACLLKQDQQERRTFSTMTDELWRLSDWLVQAGCPQGASERTGVYWSPVFNLLEGLLDGIRVHARPGKAVPGPKTAARDSAWWAALLRHGLLKARVMPPRPLRELRALTRYRSSVLRAHSAVANRMQHVIDSGHSKRGQGASEARGGSGRALWRALAAGETNATARAALARQPVKRQKPE